MAHGDGPDAARPATDADTGAPAGVPGARGAGDFERYALVAALTLFVLCLLVWDRWRDAPSSRPAPPPGRQLRVEIGGDAVPPPRTPAPPRADARSVTPDPAPRPPAPAPRSPSRSHTVAAGDTLHDIARVHLGDASRAAEIAELNGIQDPAKIRVGQVLRLPDR